MLKCAELSPSYAVSSLVLELLQQDIPECSQNGLKSLYDILICDPQTTSAAEAGAATTTATAAAAAGDAPGGLAKNSQLALDNIRAGDA